MVIFNGKGLLVGIGAAVMLGICLWAKLSPGLSFLFAGLIGLFLSIKLSVKGEGFFKKPSVFFIPTHVYSALIIVIGLVVFVQDPSLSDKSYDDYRRILMERDEAALDSSNISGVDSVAMPLKLTISFSIIRQMKPDEINYLVKQNAEGDKALVLVKFPKVDELKKEARGDFLNLVETYVQADDFFSGKKVYIGIKDESSMKVTKTPETGVHNSFVATTADLLPFYSDTALAKPN